nr:MAG TPA: hypothetical protein [Caudoviricetes sp.]
MTILTKPTPHGLLPWGIVLFMIIMFHVKHTPSGTPDGVY